MKLGKWFLLILIFIFIASCVTKNNKDNFLKFSKAEKINLKENSIYIFLPNSACSFCINTTVNYLKNIKSNRINVVFLDSEILTMIDKEAIKMLELDNIYYSTEEIANRYFSINNKEEFHSVIFVVEYFKNEIKYSTFTPDKVDDLIELINRFCKMHSI